MQNTLAIPKNPDVIHYDMVIPNINEWPIMKVNKQREEIIQKVSDATFKKLLKKYPKGVHDVVAQTMYLEQLRMKEDPWRVDKRLGDKGFWRKIKGGMLKHAELVQEQQDATAHSQEILQRIVERYSREISGTFKKGTYTLAKKVIPLLFSGLLSAVSARNIRAMFKDRVELQDRIHLTGAIESIRKLSQKGTIMLVPTHFSNLDSIIVGWGVNAIGIPSLTYGAGLNLFNNRWLSYFMNRLGAYKVDRRKKNPIYLETLKMHSTTILRDGVHSLFFPGGTRSRSGSLESRLKLGLLGTVIEAQRQNLVEGRGSEGKIFIVPLVISYHFVLEAASLIKQHLKKTGKEKYYIVNDEFASVTKIAGFVWDYMSARSEVTLSFGKPMDIFGNEVDDNGVSLYQGRELDIKAYFMSRGKMTSDSQRDKEYTKLLGERIVERYRIENTVFSSHVVAFAGFEMLRRKHAHLDLYGLLRLPESKREIPYRAFAEYVERAMNQLHEFHKAGRLKLAPHLDRSVDDIIEHGTRNLRAYHSKRPIYRQGDKMSSQNMNLLYYYHNRLNGYRLEKYI